MVITIEPIWNWDSPICLLTGYQTSITIEPIWNWDPLLKACLTFQHQFYYNRTNMELRPRSHEAFLRVSLKYYNRTNMELRLIILTCSILFITVLQSNQYGIETGRQDFIPTSLEEITIEPIWNWDSLNSILFIFKFLITIEPIWNWDPIIRYLRCIEIFYYNRTNMELRLMENLSVKAFWRFDYNRTNMELRYTNKLQIILLKG